MADAKDPLPFLERGVRLAADARLKFGRIEPAPVPQLVLDAKVFVLAAARWR